jgi:hypothetical protein
MQPPALPLICLPVASDGYMALRSADRWEPKANTGVVPKRNLSDPVSMVGASAEEMLALKPPVSTSDCAVSSAHIDPPKRR